MSKLKLKYANKSVINDLPYQQGSMMLANDSQQIYFDLAIQGIPQRRKFSGIIYLDTENQRTSLVTPSDSIYFVVATCKFYYYYVNQWININQSSSSNAIIFTTTQQMQKMTQCNSQKLYLNQTNRSLFYGINISGSVLWVSLSHYDKISDYIGDVNIRVYDGQDYFNVISTQNNSSNVQVGNTDGQLKLFGQTIKYNGNELNTSSGLVQLNENGKIPESLIGKRIYNNAYFETKSFTIQNLPNNVKTFTFEDLGIQQPTIVQLIDDQGLIRDDIIPVYWTAAGLTISFQPIAQLIPQHTNNFKIKYLVAQTYDVLAPTDGAALATKSFDPYGLTNNKKSFSYEQLGITTPTFLQLIDDDGVIRDDVIPIYWTSNGVQINFAPITSILTQAGHIWQIKYLIVDSMNTAHNSYGSSVVQLQFSPYGLSNNIKTFTYTQLNLTKRTIVQLIDNQNFVRDDIVPMYWNNNGLTIDFSPVSNLLTAGMIWKLAYVANVVDNNSQILATKSYVDSKIQEALSQINN